MSRRSRRNHSSAFKAKVAMVRRPPQTGPMVAPVTYAGKLRHLEFSFHISIGSSGVLMLWYGGDGAGRLGRPVYYPSANPGEYYRLTPERPRFTTG